jgi:hypothetical protein
MFQIIVHFSYVLIKSNFFNFHQCKFVEKCTNACGIKLFLREHLFEHVDFNIFSKMLVKASEII